MRFSYILLLLIVLNTVLAIEAVPVLTSDGSLYAKVVYEVHCTETWICTGWSACSGGTQSRTCTDSHNCDTTLSMPALTQTCTEVTSHPGTSSSGIPTCLEGQIMSSCYCDGIIYGFGYCINSTYYSSSPEEEVITSPTTFGYNFTIQSTNFSYAKGEDFQVIVRTYKDNQLADASSVHVKIFKNQVLISEQDLVKYDIGTYVLDYDNNLDLGLYDFLFSARFSAIIIEQNKQIRISDYSGIENLIRTSTGGTRPVLYFILGTVAIFILILIVIMVRRKRSHSKSAKSAKS